MSNSTGSPSPASLPTQAVNLERLCEAANAKALRSALENGRADPNQIFANGDTPSLRCAAAGLLKCLKVIFAFGGDIFLANQLTGRTPLHASAEFGYSEVAHFILDSMVECALEDPTHFSHSPDEVDHSGFTPLLLACQNGHVSVVRELMGFNADPFLPTPQGILPIELAEQKGHAEVIMALDSALRELESRHPNSDSEDEMERGEGDSTALSASSQSQLRQSAVSLPSPVLEDHIKKNLLSLSEEEPQALIYLEEREAAKERELHMEETRIRAIRSVQDLEAKVQKRVREQAAKEARKKAAQEAKMERLRQEQEQRRREFDEEERKKKERQRRRQEKAERLMEKSREEAYRKYEEKQRTLMLEQEKEERRKALEQEQKRKHIEAVRKQADEFRRIREIQEAEKRAQEEEKIRRKEEKEALKAAKRERERKEMMERAFQEDAKRHEKEEAERLRKQVAEERKRRRIAIEMEKRRAEIYAKADKPYEPRSIPELVTVVPRQKPVAKQEIPPDGDPPPSAVPDEVPQDMENPLEMEAVGDVSVGSSGSGSDDGTSQLGGESGDSSAPHSDTCGAEVVRGDCGASEELATTESASCCEHSPPEVSVGNVGASDAATMEETGEEEASDMQPAHALESNSTAENLPDESPPDVPEEKVGPSGAPAMEEEASDMQSTHALESSSAAENLPVMATEQPGVVHSEHVSLESPPQEEYADNHVGSSEEGQMGEDCVLSTPENMRQELKDPMSTSSEEVPAPNDSSEVESSSVSPDEEAAVVVGEEECVIPDPAVEQRVLSENAAAVEDASPPQLAEVLPLTATENEEQGQEPGRGLGMPVEEDSAPESLLLRNSDGASEREESEEAMLPVEEGAERGLPDSEKEVLSVSEAPLVPKISLISTPSTGALSLDLSGDQPPRQSSQGLHRRSQSNEDFGAAAVDEDIEIMPPPKSAPVSPGTKKAAAPALRSQRSGRGKMGPPSDSGSRSGSNGRVRGRGQGRGRGRGRGRGATGKRVSGTSSASDVSGSDASLRSSGAQTKSPGTPQLCPSLSPGSSPRRIRTPSSTTERKGSDGLLLPPDCEEPFSSPSPSRSVPAMRANRKQRSAARSSSPGQRPGTKRHLAVPGSHRHAGGTSSTPASRPTSPAQRHNSESVSAAAEGVEGETGRQRVRDGGVDDDDEGHGHSPVSVVCSEPAHEQRASPGAVFFASAPCSPGGRPTGAESVASREENPVSTPTALFPSALQDPSCEEYEVVSSSSTPRSVNAEDLAAAPPLPTLCNAPDVLIPKSGDTPSDTEWRASIQRRAQVATVKSAEEIEDALRRSLESPSAVRTGSPSGLAPCSAAGGALVSSHPTSSVGYDSDSSSGRLLGGSQEEEEEEEEDEDERARCVSVPGASPMLVGEGHRAFEGGMAGPGRQDVEGDDGSSLVRRPDFSRNQSSPSLPPRVPGTPSGQAGGMLMRNQQTSPSHSTRPPSVVFSEPLEVAHTAGSNASSPLGSGGGGPGSSRRMHSALEHGRPQSALVSGTPGSLGDSPPPGHHRRALSPPNHNTIAPPGALQHPMSSDRHHSGPKPPEGGGTHNFSSTQPRSPQGSLGSNVDIRATFSVDGAAHRVVARSTLESPVEYSSARFPSEDGHENSFDEEDDFYDNEVAGINQGPRSQKMEPSSRTTVEAAEIGPAAQVVAAPPQSNLVEEEAQNWRALRAQQQQCVTHHSPRGGGAGRGAPVPASSPAAGARNQLMSSPQYGVQLPPTSPRKSGMAACSITGGPAESSGAPDPPTLGSPRHTPSTRPVALFRPDILVERGFNGRVASPPPNLSPSTTTQGPLTAVPLSTGVRHVVVESLPATDLDLSADWIATDNELSDVELRIVERSVDDLRTAILSGEVNVNERDEDSRTMLMHSIARKDVDMTRMLLQCGAKTEITDAFGYSPMLLACIAGDAEIVRMLCDRGVSVLQMHSQTGMTTLFAACERDHIEVVRVLLEYGAKEMVDTPILNSRTPISSAARERPPSDSGGALSRPPPATPAFVCAEQGFFELFQLLFENEADIFSPLLSASRPQSKMGAGLAVRSPTPIMFGGWTPMHVAATNGHVDILRYILESMDSVFREYQDAKAMGGGGLGASKPASRPQSASSGSSYGFPFSPDDLTDEGFTALHMASEQGHLEAVRLLVSFGSDWNVLTPDGGRPVDLAAQHNHEDVVDFLMALDEAEDPDEFLDQAEALMGAAGAGRNGGATEEEEDSVDLAVVQNRARASLEDLRQFYEQGYGHVDDIDEHGRTALMYASYQNMPEHMAYLLEFAANVNAQDVHGCSALFFACLCGHVDLVEMLLDSGADIFSCNDNGATPLFVACQKGHAECVELVLEHAAGLSDVPLSSKPPKSKQDLRKMHKSNPHLHFLIEARVMPNHPEGNPRTGATPALCAAQEGHVDCLRLLWRFGANLTVRADGGATPLIVASQNGQVSVVRFLCRRYRFMGRSVDEQTDCGITPLFVASRQGHTDVVKLLIQYGANPWLESDDHTKAVEIAEMYGHMEIVEILDTAMELDPRNTDDLLRPGSRARPVSQMGAHDDSEDEDEDEEAILTRELELLLQEKVLDAVQMVCESVLSVCVREIAAECLVQAELEVEEREEHENEEQDLSAEEIPPPRPPISPGVSAEEGSPVGEPDKTSHPHLELVWNSVAEATEESDDNPTKYPASARAFRPEEPGDMWDSMASPARSEPAHVADALQSISGQISPEILSARSMDMSSIDPNDVPAPKPPVQIPRLSLDTLSTSEQPSSSGAPEETVPDVSEMEPARNTLDSEEQGQNVEMQRVPQAISAASSEESVKVSSAASIPPPPPPPPEDAPGRYRRSASSLSQHSSSSAGEDIVLQGGLVGPQTAVEEVAEAHLEMGSVVVVQQVKAGLQQGSGPASVATLPDSGDHSGDVEATVEASGIGMGGEEGCASEEEIVQPTEAAVVASDEILRLVQDSVQSADSGDVEATVEASGVGMGGEEVSASEEEIVQPTEAEVVASDEVLRLVQDSVRSAEYCNRAVSSSVRILTPMLVEDLIRRLAKQMVSQQVAEESVDEMLDRVCSLCTRIISPMLLHEAVASYASEIAIPVMLDEGVGSALVSDEEEEDPQADAREVALGTIHSAIEKAVSTVEFWYQQELFLRQFSPQRMLSPRRSSRSNASSRSVSRSRSRSSRNQRFVGEEEDLTLSEEEELQKVAQEEQSRKQSEEEERRISEEKQREMQLAAAEAHQEELRKIREKLKKSLREQKDSHRYFEDLRKELEAHHEEQQHSLREELHRIGSEQQSVLVREMMRQQEAQLAEIEQRYAEQREQHREQMELLQQQSMQLQLQLQTQIEQQKSLLQDQHEERQRFQEESRQLLEVAVGSPRTRGATEDGLNIVPPEGGTAVSEEGVGRGQELFIDVQSVQGHANEAEEGAVREREEDSPNIRLVLTPRKQHGASGNRAVVSPSLRPPSAVGRDDIGSPASVHFSVGGQDTESVSGSEMEMDPGHTSPSNAAVIAGGGRDLPPIQMRHPDLITPRKGVMPDNEELIASIRMQEELFRRQARFKHQEEQKERQREELGSPRTRKTTRMRRRNTAESPLGYTSSGGSLSAGELDVSDRNGPTPEAVFPTTMVAGGKPSKLKKARRQPKTTRRRSSQPGSGDAVRDSLVGNHGDPISVGTNRRRAHRLRLLRNLPMGTASLDAIEQSDLTSPRNMLGSRRGNRPVSGGREDALDSLEGGGSGLDEYPLSDASLSPSHTEVVSTPKERRSVSAFSGRGTTGAYPHALSSQATDLGSAAQGGERTHSIGRLRHRGSPKLAFGENSNTPASEVVPLLKLSDLEGAPVRYDVATNSSDGGESPRNTPHASKLGIVEDQGALLSAIEALEDTAAHVVELTKLDPEELEKMDPFDLNSWENSSRELRQALAPWDKDQRNIQVASAWRDMGKQSPRRKLIAASTKIMDPSVLNHLSNLYLYASRNPNLRQARVEALEEAAYEMQRARSKVYQQQQQQQRFLSPRRGPPSSAPAGGSPLHPASGFVSPRRESPGGPPPLSAGRSARNRRARLKSREVANAYRSAGPSAVPEYQPRAPVYEPNLPVFRFKRAFYEPQQSPSESSKPPSRGAGASSPGRRTASAFAGRLAVRGSGAGAGTAPDTLDLVNAVHFMRSKIHKRSLVKGKLIKKQTEQAPAVLLHRVFDPRVPLSAEVGTQSARKHVGAPALVRRNSLPLIASTPAGKRPVTAHPAGHGFSNGQPPHPQGSRSILPAATVPTTPPPVLAATPPSLSTPSSSREDSL